MGNLEIRKYNIATAAINFLLLSIDNHLYCDRYFQLHAHYLKVVVQKQMRKRGHGREQTGDKYSASLIQLIRPHHYPWRISSYMKSRLLTL